MFFIFDSWSDFWDFIKMIFGVLFLCGFIVAVVSLIIYGCSSATGFKLEFNDESRLDTSFNHVFVIYKHQVYGGSSISAVHYPDCPCLKK